MQDFDLNAAVEELLAYGTSEGVQKSWDTRGRGRKILENLNRMRKLRNQPWKTGQPLSLDVYHNTETGAIKHGDGGVFFAEEPTAEYGDHSLKVRLTLKNPLVVGDKVDAVNALITGPRRAQLEDLFVNQIPLGEVDPEHGFPVLDKEIATAAMAKGYDGIVYNAPESLSKYEFVALHPTSYKVAEVLSEAMAAAEATYPDNHKAGMRVPKGGSSCASCEYLADNKKDCTSEHFQKWNGSATIPAPIDEYCSDWYEPDEGIEAYGTPEGAEKGWDTRGRGPAISPGVDYKTKTGVHVGIFDRPESTRGQNVIPIESVFKHPPPSLEDREDIAKQFNEAIKVGEKTINFNELTPMQKTLLEDRLERARQPHDKSPLAVFHKGGNFYLMDGHHRIADEMMQGITHGKVLEFIPPAQMDASMLAQLDLDAAVQELLARGKTADKDWWNPELKMGAEDIEAYGTSEGVEKSWDTRGRGRKISGDIKQSGWLTPAGKFLAYENLSSHMEVLTREGVKLKWKRGDTLSNDPAKRAGLVRVVYGRPEGDYRGEFDVNVHEKHIDKAVEAFRRAKLTPGMNLYLDISADDGRSGPSYRFTSREDAMQRLASGDLGEDLNRPSPIGWYHRPNVEAAALFHGVKIIGFTKPQEEFVRATVSRIPPELMANVTQIVAAPELDAKHGRYDPDTKTININPKNFTLRQRFGKGPGWIGHIELTMVHEFGHSIYYFLPERVKDEWLELSGWMKGSAPGQAPAYTERRPGWEKHTSEWTHREGVQFTRHYAERNPDEDFSDAFGFYMLNKPHQMAPQKRKFMRELLNSMIRLYPKPMIEGPDKAYGERGN